ncbi:MAG: THUMP domain-containing protein [Candidatus Thermoplasmatota archaeon]|nr:THUMP domain-containing protein [Candidatus Thermoplasmatota archaeon]
MTNSVIIGAGWHPGLFRKEASQLIDSCEFVHANALICDSSHTERFLSRSSLISEAFSPGGIVSIENAIESIAKSFLDLNIEGKIAVKSSRSGEKIEGWSSREIAGEIGGKLVEAGREINLTNPDVTLRAHLLAPSRGTVHPDDFVSEPVVAWGITIHEGDDWSERRAPHRPFFKPVSLDPKLARTMVNLACPEGGTLLDPFCGTGGLIVEGILCGIDSYGSDLAWPMVVGTRENATWAQQRGGKGDFEIRNGSALELSEIWEDPFDGFVFDPPYGRNAWKSADGFELLEGALSACTSVSKQHANLVTLIPWPPSSIAESIETGTSFGKSWDEIKTAFSDAGWTIVTTVPIRVHRSLARMLLHAVRK